MDAVTPVPANRTRLHFIEGMRATAAIMVLINHGYAQIWAAGIDLPGPPLSALVNSMVTGHLAVSVFLCISGYCLMLPIARGNGELQGGAWLFFKRRARRILPPYYAALLLSLLLIATVIGKPTGTLWDVCIQIRKVDILSHVLLLQHFFGTGRINYSFWSISLEWQIYFLFPLLVLAYRRLGATLTTLAALLLGYSVVMFVGVEHERIHRANLHYFGLFTVGMAAARLAFGKEPTIQRVRAKMPFATLGGLLIALQVGLILHWGWQRAIDHWPLLDLFSALGVACWLVAAVAPGPNPVRWLFEARPLVSVGRYSYSLYLIHAPLMQLFWQYVISPFGLTGTRAFALLVFFGTPLILLAAQIFYRFIEAPFATSRPVAAPAAPPTVG